MKFGVKWSHGVGRGEVGEERWERGEGRRRGGGCCRCCVVVFGGLEIRVRVFWKAVRRIGLRNARDFMDNWLYMINDWMNRRISRKDRCHSLATLVLVRLQGYLLRIISVGFCFPDSFKTNINLEKSATPHII